MSRFPDQSYATQKPPLPDSSTDPSTTSGLDLGYLGLDWAWNLPPLTEEDSELFPPRMNEINLDSMADHLISNANRVHPGTDEDFDDDLFPTASPNDVCITLDLQPVSSGVPLLNGARVIAKKPLTDPMDTIDSEPPKDTIDTVSLTDDYEEEDHEYRPKVKRTRKSSAVSKQPRKRCKPKANAWSTQKSEILKSEAAKNAPLYDQAPFKNPDLERCRQNAKCAKANRDRKKREQDQMRRDLEEAKKQNNVLKKESERYRAMYAQAQDEIRMLQLAASRMNQDPSSKTRCSLDHRTAQTKKTCLDCSRGNEV